MENKTFNTNKSSQEQPANQNYSSSTQMSHKQVTKEPRVTSNLTQSQISPVLVKAHYLWLNKKKETEQQQQPWESYNMKNIVDQKEEHSRSQQI